MSVTAKHKGKGLQALTANELREGHTVWLDADFIWTRNFQQALLTEESDVIEKMYETGMRDEMDNKVIEPYFIDVDTSTQLPVRYRERFRVHGPSYDTADKLKR